MEGLKFKVKYILTDMIKKSRGKERIIKKVQAKSKDKMRSAFHLHVNGNWPIKLT